MHERLVKGRAESWFKDRVSERPYSVPFEDNVRFFIALLLIIACLPADPGFLKMFSNSQQEEFFQNLAGLPGQPRPKWVPGNFLGSDCGWHDNDHITYEMQIGP